MQNDKTQKLALNFFAVLDFHCYLQFSNKQSYNANVHLLAKPKLCFYLIIILQKLVM